jgi:type IV pilus assembly protein PilC
VKLKFPVFGKLAHKVALARFSRTLSTLLSSGVGILQAMETVAGTVSNDIISDAILSARASIREGERIGEPLARSKLFPPMVVQMISIGEESGSLDPMLAKVADFYEDEVDAAVASLTSAIEPVLIISLGVVVGFIVISLFLPLIAVIQNLSARRRRPRSRRMLPTWLGGAIAFVYGIGCRQLPECVHLPTARRTVDNPAALALSEV